MSFQTGVLNFALFTKLPSLHLPSLLTPFIAVRRRRGHWPPTRRAPGRNHLPRPRFCPHTGIPGAFHARHAPPSSFRSTRRGRRRRSRRQCYTRRRAVQPPSPFKPSSSSHEPNRSSPLSPRSLPESSSARASSSADRRPPWPPVVPEPSSSHLRPSPAPIDPGNGTLLPQRSS